MALKAGAIRFNTDSSQMEIWDGNQWTGILATSPFQQTGRTRGIWAGGRSQDIIDYANLDSTGNAISFGTLSVSHFEGFATASRTRFITGGTLSYVNTVEFVTITSTGSRADFGDQSVGRRNCAGFSNGTRGIVSGGLIPGSPYQASNTIDYVTIAQTGNFKDFGDLVVTMGGGTNTCNSQTRAIHIGGSSGAQPSISATNTMNYITMSTLGNAADFGDCATANNRGGASNSVRAVFGESGAASFITIATLGNALDFGDLTAAKRGIGATASPTRGVFAGGGNPSTAAYNVIEYVQIMTTGNVIDFGDLTGSNSGAKRNPSGCSNGHGGLG